MYPTCLPRPSLSLTPRMGLFLQMMSSQAAGSDTDIGCYTGKSHAGQIPSPRSQWLLGNTESSNLSLISFLTGSSLSTSCVVSHRKEKKKNWKGRRTEESQKERGAGRREWGKMAPSSPSRTLVPLSGTRQGEPRALCLLPQPQLQEGAHPFCLLSWILWSAIGKCLQNLWRNWDSQLIKG